MSRRGEHERKAVHNNTIQTLYISKNNSLCKMTGYGINHSQNEFHSSSIGLLSSLNGSKIKLRKYIISPSQPWYRLWKLFLVLLVSYCAWISPFKLAFVPEPRQALFIFDNFVDGLFAIDIVLTFFVAYIDRATYLLEDKPKKIAIRYLSTWFILDVCSTAPFETLLYVSTGKFGSGIAYDLLDMTRLWRLRRLSALFARIFDALCVSGDALCRPLRRMLLLPVNSSRDAVQAVSDFSNRNHLPPKLKQQIVAHMSLEFRTQGLQQQETVADLPRATRLTVAQYLFLPTMEKVYLFQGISNDFLMQMGIQMQVDYFPPKIDVILQNEAPSDLYIVVSGAVLLESVEAGDVIGEMGILFNIPQPFTARTRKLSQFLRLNKNVFRGLMQSKVADGRTIVTNLLQRAKELKGSTFEHLASKMQFSYARGLDLTLSLCFLASRGSSQLMEYLLSRGLNPNNAQCHGRTALHIASACGFIDCVQLLLRYGADPNSKDEDGSVPLWEAVAAKQEKAAHLLWENGSRLSYGKMGKFLCNSVQTGNLRLLKDLVRYEVDVNAATTDGTTALHVAVSEQNEEIVHFLLVNRADIGKSDMSGSTPMDLAEQQSDKSILRLLQTRHNLAECNHIIDIQGKTSSIQTPEKEQNAPRTQSSKPIPNSGINLLRSNCFNSLPHIDQFKKKRKKSYFYHGLNVGTPKRITIQEFHPTNQESKTRARKLIILPSSMEELLRVSEQMFGYRAVKVLREDGSQIDDINTIRDNEHLCLPEGHHN
eukprot:Gb_06791 [translate_table: standard]